MPSSSHTLQTYLTGDHLVICDRCGKKRYRSDCRKEWQGHLVCIDTCWEIRHPQDLTPPYRLDRQYVDDPRPRPRDITTYTYPYTAVDFTAFTETDPDGRFSVAATQVDADLYENSRAKLFYDYGQNFFQDFSIRFTTQGQSADVGTDSAAMLIILGGVPAFGEDYWNGSLEGVGVWVQIGSASYDVRMVEFLGGNRQWVGSALNQSYNTDMYLEFSKAAGALTLNWYSDSGFTALSQTQTGSLINQAWYQYMISPTLIYTGGSDQDATFQLKDLSISERLITPITGDDL